MDSLNAYETPRTFQWHRAEYLLGFAVCTGLLIWNFQDIRWLPAIGLFLYIDLIGYLPGAIAYRRSRTGRISKVYYYLYNVMHSLITQAVVIGAWIVAFGWEWALLGIPFHLFGDRGLFGNFMKSTELPFEPVEQPGFATFLERLRSGADTIWTHVADDSTPDSDRAASAAREPRRTPERVR